MFLSSGPLDVVFPDRVSQPPGRVYLPPVTNISQYCAVPFMLVCLGSIRMDRVISDLCYNGKF